MSKRGSTWNKWDLHIHSPKTFLNNCFNNCAVDQYVQKIVDENIRAVGLTNYFKFDSEELSEIKKKLNNKSVVVFPCVEFRTQPQNKDKEEMHVHVLFSDVVDISKIEGFLNRLKTIDDKYCQNLKGKDIQETSVAFDTLISAIENDKHISHLEDYLLIACSRGDGSYRPSKNGDGRENNLAITIDKKTDLVFGNEKDSDFFLCTKRFKNAEAKPVFSCSDAHSLNGIGSNYSWIKSEINFEGLKQVLWEPKDRIKIQERNPKDSKSKRIVIDNIKYQNESDEEKIVYLNQDLNSIIGFRGSGKSTLLKNIASAVDTEQFIEKDNKLYELKNFEVNWADGNKNNGTTDSPKSIFYIPQNYLGVLAYDEAGEEKEKERDEFLIELLKKNSKFNNATQLYSDFASTNKIKIEETIEKLLTADQTLKESRALLKKYGSIKEIEGEIKEKEKEIKKYKGSGIDEITDQELEKYTKAKESISIHKKNLMILKQDEEVLSSLQKIGADVYIANQEISNLSEKRRNFIRKQLTEKSNLNLTQLIKSQLKVLEKEILETNQNIALNKKTVDKLKNKIEANKAIKSLTDELSKLQVLLRKVKDIQKAIKISQEQKSENIEKLLEYYESYNTQQKAVFSTVKFENTFSFIEIEIRTVYDIRSLKSFVEKYINTRDSNTSLKQEKDIENLFSGTPDKPSSDLIEKVLTNLLNGNIKTKVDVEDTGQAISSLVRNRYKIDFLNSVKTKKNKVLFKDMTGGQRAITMLELIFKLDNQRYPILIDQPEDDLDVSGVANDLVKFIKNEKIDRQIIIVSHNGSLVVCSDTEQVIVSECNKLGIDKYNFCYCTGAIEKPQIKDAIIDILEGGKEALKQRARKLNFKHEI